MKSFCPPLRIKNCPTFMYSALSGPRFYEYFAIKKDAEKNCAFAEPTQEQNINFQKDNWHSPALPTDYKQTSRLYERSKDLDFQFSNPGTGQACIDTYVPSNTSNSEKRRVATITTYLIETNDYNQKQLIQSISSLDQLLGDQKGMREACSRGDPKKSKNRLKDSPGNPDLSDRAKVWCQQINTCAGAEQISRKPIIDQLIIDFPKYQKIDKANSSKLSQCLKKNSADSESALPSCTHQSKIDFMEDLKASGLLESSPLLRDEEFAAELQDIFREGKFTPASIDTVVVDHLVKERTAMVQNMKRISIQAHCLTTNNAEYISAHQSLTVGDNSCDPGRILDDTAEGSDEFPESLEEVPIVQRSSTIGDSDAGRLFASETAERRQIVSEMLQARACVKARKHDYEQGKLVFDTATDVAAFLLSKGASAMLRGGGIIARQKWIAQAARARGLMKRSRFTYGVRLKAAQTRVAVTSGQSLKDVIRSLGSECQSAEYVRGMEQVFSDTNTGSKCLAEFVNVVDDPNWLSCVEGVIGALTLGHEGYVAAKDLKRMKPKASLPEYERNITTSLKKKRLLGNAFDEEELDQVLRQLFGNRSVAAKKALGAGPAEAVDSRLKALQLHVLEHCPGFGVPIQTHKACVRGELSKLLSNLDNASDSQFMLAHINKLDICKDKVTTDKIAYLNMIVLTSVNLSQRGIHHETHRSLSHGEIVIDLKADGENRLLMSKDADYKITADPAHMCESNANGMWNPNTKQIIVPITQLFDPQLNSTTYHEFRHYFSDRNRGVAKVGREGFIHSPDTSGIRTQPWIEERLGFKNPYAEYDGHSRHDEILAREKEMDAAIAQALGHENAYQRTSPPLAVTDGDVPKEYRMPVVNPLMAAAQKGDRALKFFPMEEAMQKLLLSPEYARAKGISLRPVITKEGLTVYVQSLAKVDGKIPNEGFIHYDIPNLSQLEVPKDPEGQLAFAVRIAGDHMKDAQRTKKRLQAKMGVYKIWFDGDIPVSEWRRIENLRRSIDSRKDSIDRKLDIQGLIVECFEKGSKSDVSGSGSTTTYRRSLGTKSITYTIKKEKRKTGDGKLIEIEKMELVDFSGI